ncbi:MAG: SUMF1/EgtB/PvdO family nonheme iron enzyme [Caldilineaceae bacterium]
MDVQTWKTKARERLQAFANQINTTTPGMVYGGLAAATLLPVVTAAYQNDFSALVALTGVVGGVGGNLIANQFQAWKDRSDEAIAHDLAEKAQINPEWRQTLDTLLREFEAPRLVQAILSEADKDDLKEWFAATLRQEIAQLGSSLTIEGDWIAGDKIVGDKVGGDKTTVDVKGGAGIAVGKNIKQIVKIVNHYYQQTHTPLDEAQQRRQTVLFETYLQGVMAETGTLDLAGVDRATASNPDAAKLELAAIYTALYTHGSQEMEVGQRKAVERALLERGERARQSALAFANQTAYAALLGDPGSGKTTFTNFLALCLAGEWLENPAANLARLGDEWQGGELLPMRVILRNFAAQLPAKPLLNSQNAGDLLWQHITRRLGESLQEFAPLLKWHLLESGGLLILDGFDEVPEAQARRDIVKEAVRGFRRQFPKVRILLTSRTYAYQRQQWRLPDFAEAVLAPFDDEQIAAFVDNWYTHIAQVRPNLTLAEAQGRAALLKQSIERNRYLRELAVRPLLLTLMASLHAWRGGALPDDREQLYAESVELLLDIWERPKTVLDDEGKPVSQSESIAEWLRVPQRQIMTALEKLVYTVHAAQTSLTGTADIEEGQLVAALIAAADNPDLRPQRVVEYIRDRAGLLINRGEHIYSLPHRTFQEYLAARHLTENRFPNELVRLVRGEAERWREVLLLAGAKATRGASFSGWSLAAYLCPRPCDPAQAKDADWWAALLAGQLLVETHIYAKINPYVDLQESDTLERVRGWLAQLVSQGCLPPVDRAMAGVALGRLGDPRPGVGVKAGLPDIVWCPVDAGPFIMGSGKKKDKDAYDEQPQFICNLIQQPYRISRYPITVAQYYCFVEAQGYTQRQWWTEAGWQWRQKNNITGPGEIGGVFETPNHPQVGVSWYEAVAFCAWFSAQMNRTVRLPTEAEWERAARHTDGRLYPWPDEFASTHCNMRDTGVGATTAVGSFPIGAAVCGAADMSGNVWEWCSTKWLDGYAGYEAKVNDELAGSGGRVLRGGAFLNRRHYVRCAARNHYVPHSRINNIGFRVVAPGLWYRSSTADEG